MDATLKEKKLEYKKEGTYISLSKEFQIFSSYEFYPSVLLDWMKMVTANALEFLPLFYSAVFSSPPLRCPVASFLPLFPDLFLFCFLSGVLKPAG